jgi:hypothetical protein
MALARDFEKTVLEHSVERLMRFLGRLNCKEGDIENSVWSALVRVHLDERIQARLELFRPTFLAR